MFSLLKTTVGRASLLTAGMGLTMFGPLGWHSARENWPRLKEAITAQASSDPAAAALGDATGGQPGTKPAQAAPSAAPALPPGGVPFHDMADAFRFDVTPGWVIENWPRVSAGLGQLPLHGYRVPLVTGTSFDDVAGALTYYFNPQQQVQTITFFGTTGDPRKLTQLMVTRYGFARRLTNDPGVFLYEVLEPSGTTKSALWIRPMRVVKVTEPHGRFEVAVTLQRP
jgi:hypothetical protein